MTAPAPLPSPDRPEVVTTSQVSQAWGYAAGTLLVIGALFASKPVFGLGLLMGATVGLAWVWARWCLRGLTIERRFSQTRAFWGEEVEMAQVFTNAKPLPVPWLGVEDLLPGIIEVMSGPVDYSHKYRVSRLKSAMSLGWYERVTRRYTLKCVARGEHEFGPIEVQSGDLFGTNDAVKPGASGITVTIGKVAP